MESSSVYHIGIWEDCSLAVDESLGLDQLSPLLDVAHMSLIMHLSGRCSESGMKSFTLLTPSTTVPKTSTSFQFLARGSQERTTSYFLPSSPFSSSSASEEMVMLAGKLDILRRLS